MYWRKIPARIVIGAMFIMGVATHISGFGVLVEQYDFSGPLISLFYFYIAATLVGAGWATDVRLVTALAIVPFAQVLDTGTLYFHASYAFYSPEPTLSVIQMALLITLCIWISGRVGERIARHARVLAVLAFVVANICALVGSIWGDVVGTTLWGPGYFRNDSGMTWQENAAAREAFNVLRDTFELNALVISDQLYSILWAAALAAMAIWAALRNQRGLFLTTVTFASLHAYTQMYESFSNEPLSYVIGGLAAIPLAWGMWRLNIWLLGRAQQTASD